MNDSKLRIVAESSNDIHLVRKLLYREQLTEMKFYASQGKVSAVTVARNILVHEGGPVLLVIDSDTLDPERQREYEATALAAVEVAYTREYPAMHSLCKVFTFRPCIEVVFFETPKALERLLGKEIDERAIEEGKARPKELLQKLYGIKDPSGLEALLRIIDQPLLDLLRTGDQATRLREAVLSFMPAIAK
jgi:hypothetical protein